MITELPRPRSGAEILAAFDRFAGLSQAARQTERLAAKATSPTRRTKPAASAPVDSLAQRLTNLRAIQAGSAAAEASRAEAAKRAAFERERAAAQQQVREMMKAEAEAERRKAEATAMWDRVHARLWGGGARP